MEIPVFKYSNLINYLHLFFLYYFFNFQNKVREATEKQIQDISIKVAWLTKSIVYLHFDSRKLIKLINKFSVCLMMNFIGQILR